MRTAHKFSKWNSFYMSWFSFHAEVMWFISPANYFMFSVKAICRLHNPTFAMRDVSLQHVSASLLSHISHHHSFYPQRGSSFTAAHPQIPEKKLTYIYIKHVSPNRIILYVLKWEQTVALTEFKEQFLKGIVKGRLWSKFFWHWILLSRTVWLQPVTQFLAQSDLFSAVQEA